MQTHCAVQVDVLFYPRVVCARRRRLGEASPQQAERGGGIFFSSTFKEKKEHLGVFYIECVFTGTCGLQAFVNK